MTFFTPEHIQLDYSPKMLVLPASGTTITVTATCEYIAYSMTIHNVTYGCSAYDSFHSGLEGGVVTASGTLILMFKRRTWMLMPSPRTLSMYTIVSAVMHPIACFSREFKEWENTLGRIDHGGLDSWALSTTLSVFSSACARSSCSRTRY